MSVPSERRLTLDAVARVTRIPDWRASSQGLAATLSKQQQNVAACENAHEQSGFRRLLRGRRRLAEIRSALPRPPQRLGSSNHGLAIAPQRKGVTYAAQFRDQGPRQGGVAQCCLAAIAPRSQQPGMRVVGFLD
jgi:hypothetical protein